MWPSMHEIKGEREKIKEKLYLFLRVCLRSLKVCLTLKKFVWKKKKYPFGKKKKWKHF